LTLQAQLPIRRKTANARASAINDLVVNPMKGKQLTNIRAAGSDENILLTPPARFDLEQAIEFIDDELVEVTPKSIRLRKISWGLMVSAKARSQAGTVVSDHPADFVPATYNPNNSDRGAGCWVPGNRYPYRDRHDSITKEKPMSTNASKSKLCPSGFIYLVPGRISINGDPRFSRSPPAEEEIVADAMIAIGVATASYINPAVTLTLFEPAGCEFVMADESLRPNDIVWDFPTAGSMTKIRASVNTGTPETLNRGNSKSFRFAIKGRAGRDIKLEISVAAQPVDVLVDSCTWTIDQLGPDTLNLGGPLDD
jgi:hypothetical protein